MTNEKERVRLGELVRARRLEVGIATGRALADASQISTRTLNDIENGRRPSYSRATLWALDRALGWTRGSAQAVLDGGEPTLEPLGSGQSAASRSSTRQGASPSSVDTESGSVLTLPASAVVGLNEAELDEVMSVARAAGLQRAREILAARRRPQCDDARDGSEPGEESQEH